MSQPPSSGQAPFDSAFAALEAGFLVGSGRFTLIRLLGRGGMGVVWLARDESLREDVALKFLPHEIRFDAVALDDLRRETARSRKLTHPNIIRIHDLYKDEREAFISMEYVDGPNLGDLRVQQPDRVFTWEFLEPLVKQLCEALDYAHNERVVHRDLKPANMMLDSRGRLKLSDFGIAAQISDSATRVSMLRHGQSGTSTYMSPQQMDGKLPQVTDDIYALGATLYELLTSHPPFFTGDISYQVRNLPPQPVRERLQELAIENDVPSAVAAMIMACLGKSPDQRPQSARAVAEWIGMQTPGAAPPTSRSTSQVSTPIAPTPWPITSVSAPATTQVSARAAEEETFKPEPAVSSEQTIVSAEETSLAEEPGEKRTSTALILAVALVAIVTTLGAGMAVWWMLRSRGDGKAAAAAPAPRPVIAAPDASTTETLQASFPEKWFGGATSLLAHSTPIADIAFSADGRYFVSISADAVLRVHDAASGQLLSERLVGNRAEVKSLAIAKAGRAVAASVSGLLELFPLANSGSSGSIRAHATPVLDVAATENYLISGDQNGDVKVWNATSLSNLRQWSANPGGVRSLAVDPRSRWVVTGGKDAAIHVWSLPRGEKLASLAGHRDEIRSVSVSPDGKLIATTSRDRSLRLWTTGDWNLKRTAQWGSDANLHAGTAFSPDSHFIAVGVPGRVFLYDVETAARGKQQELSGANGVVNVVTFSPDGRVIVGGDEKGGVRVWNITSAKAGTETEATTALRTPTSDRLAGLAMPTPLPGNFTSLFNGRDLNGWSGERTAWTVTNGVLTGRHRSSAPGGQQPTSLIYQGGAMTDFDLELEFRQLIGLPELRFRATEGPHFSAPGYACLLRGQAGLLDGRPRENVSSGLSHPGGSTLRAKVSPEEWRRKTDNGNWHRLRLTVRSNHFISEIDGVVASEAHDTTSAFKQGTIALTLNFSASAEFRNIRLKR